MNIVEAYLKFKGQYIILVSGFSGSDKTKLAKFIANIMNFEFLRLSKYEYTKDVYGSEKNYVTLKDGTQVLDWDNIYESVDWDAFNDKVNSAKGGIVISGFGFPSSKIDFEPDIHIHVKLSKHRLLENRKQYLKAHPEDKFNEVIEAMEKTDALILNSITYPHYLAIAKDSQIDKFINATDMTNEQIKDEAFSYLMFSTKQWIKENKKNIAGMSESDQKTAKSAKPAETAETAETAKTAKTAEITNAAYVDDDDVDDDDVDDDDVDDDKEGEDNEYDADADYQEKIVQAMKPKEYDDYFPNSRKRYDFDETGANYPLSYDEEYGKAEFDDLWEPSASSSEDADIAYEEKYGLLKGDEIDSPTESCANSEAMFVGTTREEIHVDRLLPDGLLPDMEPKPQHREFTRT